jgi:hypothetical protein
MGAIMNDNVTTKTPWHLWVVGILGLLWSSMGVMDFVMTQTKNEAYMGSFPEEQLEFFYSFPMWVIICWAIAVFGELIGTLQILFRSKLAVPLFVVSLIGLIGTTIQNYGLSNGLEIMGVGPAIFTGVIFAVSIFLLVYSMRMSKANVLR